MSARIVVIWHERDRGRDLSFYVVHGHAAVWLELGHEVEFVFGCRRFVPADVAVLHVDLSVVPPAYLEFARRYPVALNGKVEDIRKSSFSRHLVRPGDAFDGPVIVKSDLNCAGVPERQRARRSLWRKPPRFESSEKYRVYGRAQDVPRDVYDDPACVVERFLPEREEGMFGVRLYHFFGDRASCSRLLSPSPIVRAGTICEIEWIEPHEEIVALRRSMNFDFGKFDYVEVEGQAVLLDANKTPAVPAELERTPERLARWRERALGINAFL